MYERWKYGVFCYSTIVFGVIKFVIYFSVLSYNYFRNSNLIFNFHTRISTFKLKIRIQMIQTFPISKPEFSVPEYLPIFMNNLVQLKETSMFVTLLPKQWTASCQVEFPKMVLYSTTLGMTQPNCKISIKIPRIAHFMFSPFP